MHSDSGLDCKKSVDNSVARSHVIACFMDPPEMADAIFEHVVGGHEFSGEVSQLGLLLIAVLFSFLDGVAGAFVSCSISSLVFLAAIEHEFASLAA